MKSKKTKEKILLTVSKEVIIAEKEIKAGEAISLTPQLINEDWYSGMIEDCKAIVVEREFNSRMEVIEGKWELGKRISEENHNFERSKIYGENVVSNISKHLKISTSNLYFSVQFFQQFPEQEFSKVLDNLPDGKNLSWHKITQKYLGKRKEEKEKKEEEKTKYTEKEIIEAFKAWASDTMNEGVIDEEVEFFIGYLKKMNK